MTELELNIANALITAKSALTEMIAQGLGDEQSLFVLSNAIADTYGLTQDQAIIVIEQALPLV